MAQRYLQDKPLAIVHLIDSIGNFRKTCLEYLLDSENRLLDEQYRGQLSQQSCPLLTNIVY